MGQVGFTDLALVQAATFRIGLTTRARRGYCELLARAKLTANE